MKEILETTHFEFDKSSFLIDIVRHTTGKKYIEINQTIDQDNIENRHLKINPLILNEIIEVLQNYKHKIYTEENLEINNTWDETKLKIQNRYLKGISLKELKLQFGYSEKVITMILQNNGIKIVSNELPKKKKWRRRIK